jgi:GNAT superfamily N-acetyltransferase
VLTNLKTREPLQKHGAGTMLLKWGLDRAAEEGVPAYLEAALSAAHLYESVGFKDVGRMMVDCGPSAYTDG